MTTIKICSKCGKSKQVDEFYLCGLKHRSECKECTIQRNVLYQRKVQTWKFRYGDDESRRQYMRIYYSKNKEKFVKYRANFKEKYPEYYREYFMKKKTVREITPSQRINTREGTICDPFI